MFLEPLSPSLQLFLLFVFLFFLRFPVFMFLENKWGLYKVRHWGIFWSDLGMAFLYTLIIFPVASYISNSIVAGPVLFFNIDNVPLPLRILLYFVVGDFFHYVIHRLMHLPLLWRIHMWHHSPDHMSWLAGLRASLLDATLVNVAFILAWPLLGSVTITTKLLLLLMGLLINDWMHLNIRFRLSFLEKIIITPRYHYIHHSRNEKHYIKNLAAIFPIWDKLFGTYLNPDEVEEKFTFGLNEKKSLPRLVIGV